MDSESSNSEQRPQKRPRMCRISEMSYETSVENLSKEGKETLKLVKCNSDKPCTFFDSTDPGYTWLRSGWIAQERRKPPYGQRKCCYYDPEGNKYNSRLQVDLIYAKIDKNREGIIPDNK